MGFFRASASVRWALDGTLVCVRGGGARQTVWPPFLLCQDSTNCPACVRVWLPQPSVKVRLPQLIYLFRMP